MIYFKHKQTNQVYKAHTLRRIFANGGGNPLDFDAVIAHIVYGNLESIWSSESMVIKFLDDYQALIPEHNVFIQEAE